jgi:hypothetical protein
MVVQDDLTTPPLAGLTEIPDLTTYMKQSHYIKSLICRVSKLNGSAYTRIITSKTNTRKCAWMILVYFTYKGFLHSPNLHFDVLFSQQTAIKQPHSLQ